MISAKYSLLGLFAIVAIIMVWIIFTRAYPQLNEEKTPELKEFEMAENSIARQVPRDNDAFYSIPKYMPSRSKSAPRGKVEFKPSMDNDALYFTPVDIPQQKIVTPAQAPKPAPIKPPPAAITPAAPLQPKPRQPETPVYVPQYQQPQYEQPYQPQYQQPQYQQPQPEIEPEEENFPAYYYY
jgi:hypothetical protein